MNLLENPAVKNRYKKYKLRLKKWENDFMEKYGKIPGKSDIHKADASVRDAYKKYWDLKTQALDETLVDITFEDNIKGNVSANSSSVDLNISTKDLSSKTEDSQVSEADSSVSASVNSSLDSLTKNAENIAPEKTPTKSPIKEFPAIIDNKNDSANIEGAWGDHLNKDKEIPKKEKTLLIGRSTSFQISQNKFNSGTFRKRNPRKSLSLHKIKKKNSFKSSSELRRNSNPDKKDEDSVPSSMFGEKVKIVVSETTVSGQSVNTINRLMNNEKPVVIDRKLDAGWLDRCSKDNNLEPIASNPQRLSGTSDSGVDLMDSSVSPPEFNQFISPTATKDSNPSVSDEEDYVCNSDSENEHRNKRIRNWRKSLTNKMIQQPKRLCQETVPQSQSASLSFLERMSYRGAAKKQEIQTTVNLEKEKESCKITSEKKQTINKASAPKTQETDAAEIEEKEKKSQTSKAGKSRVTRSTTSKTVSKKLDSVERKTRVVPPRRAATKTVQTRKSRKKDQEADEEQEKSDNSTENLDESDIPIYPVESFNVVPRFVIPTDSNGDLVSEFSKTIGATDSIKLGTTTKKLQSQMSDKEKLEMKVAAGKVNENFVRINLKKKIFVRGKKSFNFSRYKKGQWKQKKKDLASSETALNLADWSEKNQCFKCKGHGHMASKCQAMKTDELMPLVEDDSSEFPTLAEAEKMASQEAMKVHANRVDKLPACPSFSNTNPGTSNDIENPNLDSNEELDDCDFEFDDDFDMDDTNNDNQTQIVGHKIPAALVAKLLPPVNGAIDPLYSLKENSPNIETPKEVMTALKKFGHKNFRPGQEKAVMRILSGQSTLVTLSTGSGKSLCYQLPAYLYAKKSHCITLVISPLVSLMDDQVTGVPHFLKAAALHTGQTLAVREKIMQTIKDGNLDILLVSPEAIVAGEKSTGFGALLRQLPPIAFACIDEAHCISQWSHNFRPSYLMICRVLIEKLGVKTILGLTATATKSTAESIVEHLKIQDGLAGVISDIPMPNNLTLTVSQDEQRDRALIDLLKSERFKECDSIIVYCTRREECTRIAGYLRVSLQDTVDPNKPKPKAKVSQISEAYHAGLSASRRKVIQRSFMKGDTRIVVATVAFGMGINKPNIRSVIHYNMPSSFESYVQEVGRAGRDNLPAHCHLFLSPQEHSDKWELRRHIYSNGVDRHSIRRLLQKIFIPCSCAMNSNRSQRCPGHEVAIPIDETVKSLDLTEETISTLLCYLELHPKKFITVLSSVYVNAKITSYAGPQGLKDAAQTSPPLAMAIALDAKKGISHEKDSIVEFPVVDVAAAIGWDSGVVKNHLKSLEWKSVDGRPKRSVISVKYETLGLRVKAPGDLQDSELDEALEALFERTQSQEKSALHQLEAIHAALNKFSQKSVNNCFELNEENVEKSENLKKIIREYFQSDSPLSVIDFETVKSVISNEGQIASDVRGLISSYRDNNFSGRAVARIFHGIQSPNYPAYVWFRCRFWRSHIQTNFNFICQIATREILAMR